MFENWPHGRYYQNRPCHSIFWNNAPCGYAWIKKNLWVRQSFSAGEVAAYAIHAVYTGWDTIPYAIAHHQACFDMQGNGDLLHNVSKIHCLANENKPDKGYRICEGGSAKFYIPAPPLRTSNGITLMGNGIGYPTVCVYLPPKEYKTWLGALTDTDPMKWIWALMHTGLLHALILKNYVEMRSKKQGKIKCI